MIELQNIVAANDVELNEDEDTLNLKVNNKVNKLNTRLFFP